MGLFRKKKKKRVNRTEDFKKQMLTSKSPFAVQEAYKTIRTNIMFSIPGDRCKRIVVTSATQGEAKSTTAVNLSIAFAQNNAKVLLIDCDLRLPTVATKLNIIQTPGLSNVLVGLSKVEEAIRHSSMGLDVMTAGDVPPNPSELLGSDAMEALMEKLSLVYDYIIMDTPPVCTVADATIVSKFTDGVIMTVRQNLAYQETVSEAIQRLEFANAKILGFIFTDVDNEKLSNYKAKGYYRYGYGYGYGYGYSNSYSNAQKAAAKAKK